MIDGNVAPLFGGEKRKKKRRGIRLPATFSHFLLSKHFHRGNCSIWAHQNAPWEQNDLLIRKWGGRLQLRGRVTREMRRSRKGGKKTVRLESGNLVGWMLTSESSQQGKLLRRSNVFKGLWILVVVVDQKQLHNSTFNQSQKDGAEAHMFTVIDRHFFFYLHQWSSARSVQLPPKKQTNQNTVRAPGISPVFTLNCVAV